MKRLTGRSHQIDFPPCTRARWLDFPPDGGKVFPLAFFLSCPQELGGRIRQLCCAGGVGSRSNLFSFLLFSFFVKCASMSACLLVSMPACWPAGLDACLLACWPRCLVLMRSFSSFVPFRYVCVRVSRLKII